ncbi:DUF1697 domain-containing protein [Streptomyces sp. NPDC050560]|uniref:DUF1697 domain-containing protein n=1 Tax=Streptomyces sp. NPDC050560 TaxID=3365630 RepID=UPI0037BA96B1
MKTTYAALLRGVNVGARKVPMAELRTLMATLGLDDVRTHLQSGNAVFTADPARQPGEPGDGAEERLAARIEHALQERFGFPVGCVVRDGAYLRAAEAGCPFPAASLAGRQLHATFFSAPVDPARFAGLDPADYAPEDYRLGDRVLYLYAPEGLGRSRLGQALARPALTPGVVATSRNWNTVARLVEMTR